MVLGLIKPRTRAEFALAPVEDPRIAWEASRGRLVHECIGDLSGAFPGYTDLGGRLDHAQIRIWERFLVVDESSKNGFALDLDRIVATDDGELDSFGDGIIRIRYQDGNETRLFSIRPRAGRLTLRGSRRSLRLCDELFALGVPGGPVDDVPIDTFITHWGDTQAFGHEAVVWHGLASASLALTGERAPCDVFITSKSLVWGRDAKSPISRVPLTSIRDVTPGKSGVRSMQAAAFVGFGDSGHDRMEFPFVFDSYDTEDRNALERSAFVVHLRSRPVALAYPEAAYRPWIPPVFDALEMPSPLWPSNPVVVRGSHRLGERVTRTKVAEIDSDEPRKPKHSDPAERLRPDRGVITAEEWIARGDVVSSWPLNPVPEPIEDIEAVADEQADDVVLSEWSVPESMASAADACLPETQRADPAVCAVLPAVCAFEAAAITTLSATLEMIRRRESGDLDAGLAGPPPSGTTLTAALDEVIEAMARGDVAPELALKRKQRLLSLDDAAHRLTVLLPLHANGAITTDELLARRDALCAELGLTFFVA